MCLGVCQLPILLSELGCLLFRLLVYLKKHLSGTILVTLGRSRQFVLEEPNDTLSLPGYLFHVVGFMDSLVLLLNNESIGTLVNLLQLILGSLSHRYSLLSALFRFGVQAHELIILLT